MKNLNESPRFSEAENVNTALPVTPKENLIFLPYGFGLGYFGFAIALKIYFWMEDKE